MENNKKLANRPVSSSNKDTKPSQKVPRARVCLEIFRKDPHIRSPEEISKLARFLGSLNIFKHSQLSDSNPEEVLSLLTSCMRIETFPDDSAIFHLEKPADKVYIIMQGKAQEFVPKTLAELDQEYQATLRSRGVLLSPAKSITKKAFSPSRVDVNSPRQLLEVPGERKTPRKLSIDNFNVVRGNLKSLEKVQEMNSFPIRSAERKISFPLYIRKASNTPLDSPRTSSNASTPPHSLSRSPVPSPGRTFNNIMPALNSKLLLLSPVSENVRASPRPEEEGVPEVFKKNAKQYFMGSTLKVKFKRLLQVGDYVGMEALENHKLRTTTLLSLRDCICVSLHKDDYARVLRQRKTVHREKISFFNDVFADIAEDHVTAFSMFWEERVYQKNEMVFQEGSSARHVYLLQDGEVTLTKEILDMKDAAKVDQEEIIVQAKKKNGVISAIQYLFKVGIFSGGHTFGAKDFFNHGTYEVNATVSSSSAKIYFLDYHDYQQIRLTFSDIFNEIMKKAESLSMWKKERISDFHQMKQIDHTREGVFQDYMDHKKKAFKSSPTLAEKFIKLKKPKINPIDISKLEASLEFKKYWTPRPGKNVPDYLTTLAKELKKQTQSNLPSPRKEEIKENEKGKEKVKSVIPSLQEMDWVPFVKKKGIERLHIKDFGSGYEGTPTSTGTVETRDTTTVIKRKLTGSLSTFDPSLFSPKKTSADLPLIKRVEIQTLNEDNLEKKLSIQIPKLFFESRPDVSSLGPLSTKNQSVSLRSSPKYKTPRDRFHFHFEAMHSTGESTPFTPINIKALDKEKDKESPARSRLHVDSPEVSVQKGLSKFFPAEQYSPIKAESYEDFNDAIGALTAHLQEKKRKSKRIIGNFQNERCALKVSNPLSHRRSPSEKLSWFAKGIVTDRKNYKGVSIEPLSARGNSLDVKKKKES